MNGRHKGSHLLGCEVPGELCWPWRDVEDGPCGAHNAGAGQWQERDLQAALVRLCRPTCTSFTLLETIPNGDSLQCI